jgi:hypothetical protein
MRRIMDKYSDFLQKSPADGRHRGDDDRGIEGTLDRVVDGVMDRWSDR